jgi:SAM-dependent methyltransferase
MLTCRICGNLNGNRSFTAREMMFGTREVFDYFECAVCGCLQIVRIPENLGKYYPPQYHSFTLPGRLKTLIKGPWLCDPYAISTAFRRAAGFLPGVRRMPEWMKRSGLSRSSSILDVGCGRGARLLALRAAGYGNATGVDPFVDADVILTKEMRVLKKYLNDVQPSYDLIMLHHSLEHMPDQTATLGEVARILKPAGIVLIRIPLASSEAWKRYSVDWVALDAPRHLYLHTVKSLEYTAGQVGLEIYDRFYDSEAFQFWASEQYRKDIPLNDPRSYELNPGASIFTRRQIRSFAREAERLNQESRGDTAAFYLRKTSRVRRTIVIRENREKSRGTSLKR